MTPPAPSRMGLSTGAIASSTRLRNASRCARAIGQDVSQVLTKVSPGSVPVRGEIQEPGEPPTQVAPPGRASITLVASKVRTKSLHRGGETNGVPLATAGLVEAVDASADGVGCGEVAARAAVSLDGAPPKCSPTANATATRPSTIRIDTGRRRDRRARTGPTGTVTDGSTATGSVTLLDP